jgi:cation transport regulator ChaB
MFEWLKSIVAWLATLWNKLPEEQKKQIIEVIVSYFEKIFRSVYNKYNDKSKSEEES